MNKNLLILHSQLNDMKLWAHPGNFLLLQQLSCLRYLAFLLTRGEKPLDPVPGFRSRCLGDSGTLLCAWERGDSTCSASGKAAVVSKQTENVKEEGPKQQSEAVFGPRATCCPAKRSHPGPLLLPEAGAAAGRFGLRTKGAVVADGGVLPISLYDELKKVLGIHHHWLL